MTLYIPNFQCKFLPTSVFTLIIRVKQNAEAIRINYQLLQTEDNANVPEVETIKWNPVNEEEASCRDCHDSYLATQILE